MIYFVKYYSGKFFSVFFILTILLVSATCSDKNQTAFLNSGEDEVAIEGFDPVAYFAVDGAAKGNPHISAVWRGVKWYFSTVENKEEFLNEPEKYVPQYEGLCSLNLALGERKMGDPRQFEVRDGKLYLQNNEEAHKIWKQNEEALIKKANKNWEEINREK